MNKRYYRSEYGSQKKRVEFADKSILKVDNIIGATGYKFDYSWLNIDGVFDSSGNVVHQRGITNVQGLYFISLPWQYRRGSALLQGVGDDAKFIVDQIKNNF